ncbi:MAG: hypothetical protein ACPGWS_06155, partial [Solirubrobacterales bacterium]
MLKNQLAVLGWKNPIPSPPTPSQFPASGCIEPVPQTVPLRASAVGLEALLLRYHFAVTVS